MSRPSPLDDPSNANLKSYIVELYENLFNDDIIEFQCWAENEDHAIEQAENAYPGKEIVCVF